MVAGSNEAGAAPDDSVPPLVSASQLFANTVELDPSQSFWQEQNMDALR